MLAQDYHPHMRMEMGKDCATMTNGVTRHDILQSRLEECECDSIELRCQGHHEASISKLVEALSITIKLHGKSSDATNRARKQVASACNVAAASMVATGNIGNVFKVLDTASEMTAEVPEGDIERTQLRAATHRLLTRVREMCPDNGRQKQPATRQTRCRPARERR